MIRKLGYACINETLKAQKISTNRGMKLDTYNKKGISYASELALLNIIDLEKVIQWNHKNDISFFRISSDIFPWNSKYNIEDLPDYNSIKKVLSRISIFVKENNHRITSHPGPFNLLASPNQDIVSKTILELENHSKVFDLLNLEKSPYNKINIHIGATYNDKKTAAARWCLNFNLLSENCKSRLTIENDDKESMYSVDDLFYLVFEKTGTPIVFDYHHHKFCTGGFSEENALIRAYSTWPKDIIPAVHYSESKSLELNDPKIKLQAHSDYINGPINSYNKIIDVMIESKQKEKSLLLFRKNYRKD